MFVDVRRLEPDGRAGWSHPVISALVALAWVGDDDAGFESILEDAVEHVARTVDADVQGLLWFLVCLTYHRCGIDDARRLSAPIVVAARHRRLRQEVDRMSKSAYQVIGQQFDAMGRVEGRVEGRIEASQDAVLRVLRAKFGTVPDRIEQRVRATRDSAVLDHWLVIVVTAPSLEAIGFDS